MEAYDIEENKLHDADKRPFRQVATHLVEPASQTAFEQMARFGQTLGHPRFGAERAVDASFLNTCLYRSLASVGLVTGSLILTELFRQALSMLPPSAHYAITAASFLSMAYRSAQDQPTAKATFLKALTAPLNDVRLSILQPTLAVDFSPLGLTELKPSKWVPDNSVSEALGTILRWVVWAAPRIPLGASGPSPPPTTLPRYGCCLCPSILALDRYLYTQRGRGAGHDPRERLLHCHWAPRSAGEKRDGSRGAP